jgi:serine/alanine adding enzyme
MKVVREIERKKWSDFICNHPHGNIFQTPEMYEVYKETANYQPIFLAVVNEKHKILGTLLSVIQREYKGYFSTLTARSVIWGGPLVRNDDEQVFHLILNEYEKIARKMVLYSQFRNLWNIEKFSDSFRSFSYSFKDHLNIIIDLNKPESLLWKEVHPKRRNEIRRAYKEGTYMQELVSFSDIDSMYEILHKVYNNAKMPIADKSLFAAAFKILAPLGLIKYFGAYNNQKIIGVVCILAYKKILYDWYAGSHKKFYNKYPNDLLPWEVLKWGKEKGYTLFDFGGAGRPDEKYGVREFKKKFGGKLINYGRYEKIHQPMKYKIVKAGFKLWQKLKI